MTVVVVAVADAETTSNCYSHNMKERLTISSQPLFFIFIPAVLHFLYPLNAYAPATVCFFTMAVICLTAKELA